MDPKADRSLLLYGYLRGSTLKPHTRLHLAGVGDFELEVRLCVCVFGGVGWGGGERACSGGGGAGSSSSSKNRVSRLL